MKKINFECPCCFKHFDILPKQKDAICPHCKVGISQFYPKWVGMGGRFRIYPEDNNGSWDNTIQILED